MPPPSDQLVTQTVFSSSVTANQAVTSMYGSMSNESYKMSLNTGLLADELKNYSATTTQLAFYHNAMSSSTIGANNGCWSNAYNYIYQANAILEGVKNNSLIPNLIVTRLTGEAKFIRAFWHFYLTICYGDIPMATSTDYRTNKLLKRSARADIFKFIIADLKDAKSLLPDQFMNATDTVVTSERLRANSWAARALLARVYLYTKNYDSAAMESETVINNSTLFNLNSDLNQVFLANSADAIWQNAYQLPNSVNTWDGFNFILTAAPRRVALSTILLNSFESGDNRLINWVNHIGSSTMYYYPFKYKVRESIDATVHTEHTMVLRLSEQYLIRSEARAQQNDIAGALEDLNAIRHRAGLTDYTGAQDQSSVLAAILHERQVELFTEWGHRWFDLARTGNINTVMDSVAPMKGGTWNADGHQQLFPIPQSERIANPNLTQNPGYN